MPAGSTSSACWPTNATIPMAASPRTSASRPSLPSSSRRPSCNASCSSSPSSACCGCLSGSLPIKVGTFEFSLPGYMVWAAVLYALFGSILTYALGRGLIEAGNVRQGREADVRSVLIRARENAEGIALMRGEADERARLQGAMGDLRRAWHAQTRGQGSLALLTSCARLSRARRAADRGAAALSGWRTATRRADADGPGLLQRAMGAVVADRQLPALRRLARLGRSRRALCTSPCTISRTAPRRRTAQQIEVHAAAKPTSLIMRELGLARPDGEMLVAEAEVEIQACRAGADPRPVGQRQEHHHARRRRRLAVGPRAHPSAERPPSPSCRRSHISRSARCATSCSIPKVPEGITDDLLKDMLHKVGLDHLRGRLDEDERWDHILSGGEQQRVAFARVLIHKPGLDLHGRGDLGAR